jgi:hypothetical protein
MVKVIELVSQVSIISIISKVSLISLVSMISKSQRFQGFMFNVDVHSSGSLFKFTSWVHIHIDAAIDVRIDPGIDIHIDPEFAPKVSRCDLLQHPRSGWFEGHHGRR